ncbi:MAG: hypothetical protein Q4E45_09000 [Eubacteriales bacterium]|nr:hypothetical protein [Eubacteriales bacterium]
MKRIIMRGLSLFFVVALTLSLLFLTNEVLVMKRSEGISPLEDVCAHKRNPGAVWCLGSRHVGMNLDMEALWTDYGIPGYALWGSIQPFWNSYYFLLEALKTQNPKVVVLDVHAAVHGNEYSDDARQVMNIAGMKLSINKLRAIRVSAPCSRWSNLLLGLPIYHKRYTEITREDFMHFPWSRQQLFRKGTDVHYGTEAYTFEDPSGITDKCVLPEKQVEYLRLIIEECQRRCQPLVLIKTPTNNRLAAAPYMNAVQEIADEYGLTFIDYNLMDDETGVTSQDYFGGTHINTNGTRKVTRHLGSYLKTHYDLPDRRGEASYESWETFSRTMQNNYIRMITSTGDFFKELQRDDRCVLIIKNSSWDSNEAYDVLLKAIEGIGVNEQAVANAPGGVWMLTSTCGGEMLQEYYGDMYSDFDYDGTHFTVDFSHETGVSMSGESLYKLEEPGLVLLVYDPVTHEKVDLVTFLVKDGFVLKRP